uniref:radical SAM protein n=1 Tax=Candidatus Cryptobacteroides bacterium TaxID=3085639 RepID=UPI0040270063
MAYSIRPSYFSHIYPHAEKRSEKVHAIVYDKCNYSCGFCNIKQRDHSEFHDYQPEEFVYVVSQLLKQGNSFKFTGGEPTINPGLIEDMEVVRDLGGFIYLDTNGSRPDIVRTIVDKKLVDVLAVSLKGLGIGEAQQTSNCRNKSLCWDNVFQSIMSGLNAGIPTIVTHVYDAKITESAISSFFNLFPRKDNLFLKCNNLFYEKHSDTTLRRIEENGLIRLVKRVLDTLPLLKGHIIICNSEECITDYTSIITL